MATEPLGPPFPHTLRRRRPQRQIGQRGAQVEAGPADDDRTPAFGQKLVDLVVGELRVLSDAELRIYRQEGDQPVLELRLLAGPGGARQQLEPLVHLQRVG